MPRILPLELLLVCAVVAWTGAAEAAVPPSNETNAPAVVAPLLEESVLWDKSISLRAGVGYKDNVLLGSVNRQGSPFVLSGFDLSILRLPIDGTEFYFFASGDDYRYWHSVGVDKEETFIATTELRHDFGNRWWSGVNLQYAYQNQVMDVSTFESGLITARLQGHNITLRPSIRRDLNGGWWTQLEFAGTRQFQRQPLDSYWQAGPKAILGLSYARRSEFTFSYAVSKHFYDHREFVDASGFVVPGTRLEFLRQRVELASRHYWDTNRYWRTNTRLVFDNNQDNGSHYFDYYRYQVSEELRFANSGWEARAQTSFSYYDFALQRVSLTDPRRRYKSGLVLNLRLEKKFGSHFKIFGEAEREYSFSNQSLDEYRVNIVSGGMEWEF